MWYWHKDWNIAKQKRIESRSKSTWYSTKEPRQCIGKRRIFSTSSAGILVIHIIYTKILTHNLYQTQKLTENESQINLIIKAPTIKPLQNTEEKNSVTLGKQMLGKHFIDTH